MSCNVGTWTTSCVLKRLSKQENTCRVPGEFPIHVSVGDRVNSGTYI